MADDDGKPGGLAASTCGLSTRDDSPWLNADHAVSDADKAHTLAAPGISPYTTLKGDRFGHIQSGTSMATAALSGVVLNCLATGTCSGTTGDTGRMTARSSDRNGGVVADPEGSPGS